MNDKYRESYNISYCDNQRELKCSQNVKIF